VPCSYTVTCPFPFRNFSSSLVFLPAQVALLNFDFKEEAFDQKEINHDVGLLDKKTFKVFNDKLSFKYIEIAKFNKSETELETLYDKWLYVLKNLPKLDKRPKALKERIFTKLFEEAEIAKFSQQELREYEDSLKAYRDIKNSIDTAKEEGREEGIAKEKLATAKRLLGMGLTQEQVAQGAGLSIEDIERLI
jgi:predicted transposase/invertase (TIGR01784 family)